MTPARIAVAAFALLALTACGPDANPARQSGVAASPSPIPSPSDSPSPSPEPLAATSIDVPTVAAPPVATTGPAPHKTTAAAPKTTKPAAPKTTKPAPPPAVYYKNCDDVRAHGAAPLYRGQPGYRAGLDRDNDGVACET